MFRCSRCGQMLPRESFRPNPKMRSHVDSWCRACYAAANREWRRRNVQALRIDSRRRYALNRERWLAAAKRRYASTHPPRTPYRGECVVCGSAFLSYQPTRRYCDGGAVNKRGRWMTCAERGRQWGRKRRAFSAKERIETFERDDWRCYLCDEPIPPDLTWPHADSATVEHVIPLAAGGDDDPTNLRAAHWRCNRDKGTALLEAA